MATVYSLIAWGGRTGKTVSLSASTDVVTLTNHGLRDGTKLWPSGTLPSELNTSTPVYARSTAADTFTLHTSSAGAIANTGQITFAGSSTYASVVLKSDLVANASSALAPYGLSDLSRWGSSGSERIYDGLVSWRTARNAASTVFDEDVCELGDSFYDRSVGSGSIEINIPSARVFIVSKINGIRTAAYHGGNIDAGFVLYKDPQYNAAISFAKYDSSVDGFTIKMSSGGYGPDGIVFNQLLNSATKMVLIGAGNGSGIKDGSGGCTANRCVSIGWDNGLSLTYYRYGTKITNCLFAKNNNGVISNNTSVQFGFFYNNISIGNTTSNWQSGASSLEGASNNAGLSTDTIWTSGANPTVSITTSAFASWGGASWASSDDYRPALSSSPQVDAGTAFYGISVSDITDAEAPNYNNGGSEAYDIGAYEFDHGYGPHPASHELTLNNVVVGSRVFIRDQADTVTHHNAVSAASTVVVTITVYGDSRDNWRIRIRKASDAPKYLPYETLMTATPGSSSIYVSQLPDPIAS